MSGLTSLTPAEALRLLATRPVGRLAFTRRALPDILPVNYVVVGADVLIRLAPDSSVARAVRNAVVAIETDDLDAGTRTGWSVTVVGEARPVEGEGPVTWAPGERDALFAISTERITGRRLG